MSVAGIVLGFNVGQQVGRQLLLTNLTRYQGGGNDTARISSLKYYLDQCPLQQPPTDALVRLAELDLNLNSFEFNNAYYHQVGVAMGTKMGPNLPYVCSLGMSRGECLRTTKETNLNFTNVILMMYLGTLQDLEEFIHFYSTYLPSPEVHF